MASGQGDTFEQYARFGKTEAQIKEMKSGLRIETKNVQKLCKECGVVDGKYTTQLLDNDIMRVIGRLTTEGKHPKGVKTLDKNGFDHLLRQIAESKKTSYEAIHHQIQSARGPSLVGTTGVANAANVARMTDVSGYTGSHKERFDESGKGKGVDGRVDRHENTGYVGNYKGANTYDKKH